MKRSRCVCHKRDPQLVCPEHPGPWCMICAAHDDDASAAEHSTAEHQAATR